MCKGTFRDYRTVQRHQAAETAMDSNTLEEDINPGDLSTPSSHHNDEYDGDMLLDEDDCPNNSEQEDEPFTIPSDRITNYVLGELHTKLTYGYSHRSFQKGGANEYSTSVLKRNGESI